MSLALPKSGSYPRGSQRAVIHSRAGWCSWGSLRNDQVPASGRAFDRDINPYRAYGSLFGVLVDPHRDALRHWASKTSSSWSCRGSYSYNRKAPLLASSSGERLPFGNDYKLRETVGSSASYSIHQKVSKNTEASQCPGRVAVPSKNIRALKNCSRPLRTSRISRAHW